MTAPPCPHAVPWHLHPTPEPQWWCHKDGHECTAEDRAECERRVTADE